MSLVFEGANNIPLDDIRVPGFYTYAGFRRSFIARLGDISEQVKQEQWVLGDAGKQAAVAEQYEHLPDDLLQLYTRDYLSAWRDALGRLRLRKLTADRPRYTALSAISAATSPVRTLLDSVRLETELTKPRPGFDKPVAKTGPDGKPVADAKPATPAAEPQFLDTQGRAPGSDIETAFKPFNVIVEGDSSGKTIDALIANLAEINGSLTQAATNPPQIPQAAAMLQQQVAKLRGVAARLPEPFANMTRQASNDFEQEMAQMSGTVIRVSLGDQVTRACKQVVESGYPFTRGSREVSLTDFGRVFGPGGVLDKFFKDNLAPLADTSRKEWVWRAGNATANTLRVAALHEFQRAAEIRDAYFQTGGMQPGFPLAVVPPKVDTPGLTVKFEVNGAAVETKQGGAAAPVSLQWPGAAGISRTAITVTVENPPSGGMFGSTPQPPAAPAVLERTGAWSLFRMLEAGAASKHGDRMVANFALGGHVWQYQFGGGSVHNPLNLALLREFRCPGGI
jgi:type VI secretion system protein ImpL